MFSLKSNKNSDNILEVISNHILELTDIISVDLMYFSDKFVENNFITERAARDVHTKLGISNSEKANELLHKVEVNYRSAQEKWTWAAKFIAIFDSEAAYSDLATLLRREAFTEL